MGAASVSVQVVQAPGIHFQSIPTSNLSAARRGSGAKISAGISLLSKSYVAVEIKSVQDPETIYLKNGEAKVLSVADLRSVEQVRITYLGS